MHWVLDMSVAELGQTIRRLRKERGLTQQELAKLVGISRATLSGVENNTIPELGVRKYERLLNMLGQTLPSRAQVSRPTLDELMEHSFDD